MAKILISFRFNVIYLLTVLFKVLSKMIGMKCKDFMEMRADKETKGRVSLVLLSYFNILTILLLGCARAEKVTH